jgi:hypothetical protein
MKYLAVRLSALFNTKAFELFNIPVKYIEIYVSLNSIHFAFFAVLPEMPRRFKFIIKPVVVEIPGNPQRV